MGGLGATAEMQVTELMLNSCDSTLVKQPQSGLSLEENHPKRVQGRDTPPENPFLAPHNDNAKMGFKVNKANTDYCVQHSTEDDCVHKRRSTGCK